VTTPPPAVGSEPVFTGFHDGRVKANFSQPIVAEYGYLTPQAQWGDVERGNPLPYTLPPERRREVGLERDTWQLEIVADTESPAELEAPLTRQSGTAIDFQMLLELGAKHGVRILKGVTCNNLGEPLGMGLWEGVPLRVLVWMARPLRNVRRVVYFGYHNDDPRQMFQSSLPLSRVLEEPPGELPILVAYKLNGEFISGKRGGPVRMVVPEAYGFKSVKWLQRVVLTNHYAANDTYHLGNNDLDSPMKSFARFVQVPSSTPAGQPIEITGVAQAGVSGVRRVEVSTRLATDAPFDADAEPGWRPAEILGPPREVLSTELTIQRPEEDWPLRFTLAHWRATLPALVPGEYELRCRTIDLNGIAQPMPRPFPKSGRAEIQRVPLHVTA
jgi:DMSO/TMAO reductase YedYZ molybdopterin-dependent catalytic subunit